MTTLFLLRVHNLAQPEFGTHSTEIADPLDSKEEQQASIMKTNDEPLRNFDFPGWKMRCVGHSVERAHGYPAHAFYSGPHLWGKCVCAVDRQKLIAVAKSMLESRWDSLKFLIAGPMERCAGWATTRTLRAAYRALRPG